MHNQDNQFFDIAAKKFKLMESEERYCPEEKIYYSEEKRFCTFEGFLRCTYDFTNLENEPMTVEYTLAVCDDKYRPYGIKAVLRDGNNKIVECGTALKKFATLSECVSKMYMMACETVLPCTVEYIL